MRFVDQLFLFAIFGLGIVAAPVFLVWGWIRWIRAPKSRDLFAASALIALICASASAAAAVVGVIYSGMIGGFPYYDPRLLRIISIGLLIALIGLLFGLTGAWRRNSLRWLGWLSALGMLAFWVCVAEGE